MTDDFDFSSYDLLHYDSAGLALDSTPYGSRLDTAWPSTRHHIALSTRQQPSPQSSSATWTLSTRARAHSLELILDNELQIADNLHTCATNYQRRQLQYFRQFRFVSCL